MPCPTALTWNTKRSPKSFPKLRAEHDKGGDKSKYITSAVETDVAGAFKSAMMGPSDTGSALMLMPI